MIAAFLSIAALAFGPASCGDAQVNVRAFPGGAAGHSVFNGTASTVPGQELPACTIEITPETVKRGPAFACTVVVHEYGHITGHQHSSDPRNVMYWKVTRPYWRCSRAYPAPPVRTDVTWRV